MREQDRQCAEALGYSVRQTEATAEYTSVVERFWALHDASGEIPEGFHLCDSEWEAWNDVPHYSTDIADAWTLIDHMIGRGYLYGLGNLEFKGPRHEAAFYRDGSGPSYGEGETPAAAIAAAFLKVKQVAVVAARGGEGGR